jgi:hypothetical protein
VYGWWLGQVVMESALQLREQLQNKAIVLLLLA